MEFQQLPHASVRGQVRDVIVLNLSLQTTLSDTIMVSYTDLFTEVVSGKALTQCKIVNINSPS